LNLAAEPAYAETVGQLRALPRGQFSRSPFPGANTIRAC